MVCQNRDEDWVHDALHRMRGEAMRSGETPLIRLALRDACGIDLYVKDESGHPTGSLKHRLARALFLHALCSGWVGPDTTIVEASSGSTAVSEAWFARLLGLSFIAVMPRSTAPEKIGAIEALGGDCVLIDSAADAPDTARRIAERCGHFMDQFRYAERVTAWMAPSNLAAAALAQMRLETHPEPAWFVVGAGTGGTATTIGRSVRHHGLRSRLCVVDVPGSLLLEQWAGQPVDDRGHGSIIEGIGRPRFEASFVTTVVDAMVRVPDDASIAAMRALSTAVGRRCGGSSGTNLIGALVIAESMHAQGEHGSIVTVLCDGGDRYESTLYDPQWTATREPAIAEWTNRLHNGGLLDELPLLTSDEIALPRSVPS